MDRDKVPMALRHIFGNLVPTACRFRHRNLLCFNLLAFGGIVSGPQRSANGTATYTFGRCSQCLLIFGTATFCVSTNLLSVEYEWTDKVPMALPVDFGAATFCASTWLPSVES